MPIKGQIESFEQGEERQFERRELWLETSGSATDGTSTNVTIHNISQTGMLLETELDLTLGETLSVELPQAGTVSARIVWRSDALYGCRFDQELAAAVLSAAELQSETRSPFTLGGPEARGSFGSGNFGKRIEQLRKARGMTLSDVAERLGVSKPTVWAWEKGKARPIEDRFPALARTLGVEEQELHGMAAPQAGQEALYEARNLVANAFGLSEDRVRIFVEL